MKITGYQKYVLMILVVFLLCHKVSVAQCNTDAFLDKCASNLGTYNYIKSFVAVATRKKAKTEYSYVFSKGSKYIMLACAEDINNGKMIISLFDRNHTLIASTYDENTKKYYTELEYPCSATGVYYVKTTFEGTKNGCGLCILGFSKDK